MKPAADETHSCTVDRMPMSICYSSQ